MSDDRQQQTAQTSARAEKRAQFVEDSGKGLNLKLLIVILALAGVAGYLVISNMSGGEASQSPLLAADMKPSQEVGADEVRIPLKDLEGGKAVFIEPKLASGKPVRFFVVKASDDTYRAALDACEVCFHAKLGYEQQGKDMICRNCGRDFAIDDIGPHNEGGCHPIALTRTIEGDQLVIKTSELEKGSSYF